MAYGYGGGYMANGMGGSGLNMQMQQFTGMQQQLGMMQQIFSQPSQAMQNLMRKNIQDMIQQQLTDWQAQNPDGFKQMAERFAGKSREDMVQDLRTMAKERGFNLEQVAMQFGIAL